MQAAEVIEKLGLMPLPEEGGYYKETFKDEGTIPDSALANHAGKRKYSTCIYYLITANEYSHLHALRSAEVFHFYAGDPARMIQITARGDLKEMILGPNFANHQRPQTVVQPCVWQGTKLVEGGRWALFGCTVAPGFEFADFIPGNSAELIKAFPQHEELILEYTK